MITPELLAYIREEFAKGRAQEAIHADLVAEGGWSESDLVQAFKVKTAPPKENFVSQVLMAAPSPIPPPVVAVIKKKSKSFWPNIAFVLVGLGCIALWYFYRPQIVTSWSSLVARIHKISLPSFSFSTKKETPNTVAVVPTKPVVPVIPAAIVVKQCGTTASPDLKKVSTYTNNAVLDCLGESASKCEDARAVFTDDLFPTSFNIISNKDTGKDTCRFRLSYAADSTLVDKTGQKLASQYISCPLQIVKAIDESKKVPSFSDPATTNFGKYASQIYFYGTLGVFIEHDLKASEIQSLGCVGGYVSSVIASYNTAQQSM